MSKIWGPSDILIHHGIKGQKWGHKNGPPYPLGPSDHSASEKKAGWKKSLNSSNDKKRKNRNNGEKGLASKYSSNDELIKEVLKSNPNAAVVNPTVGNWIKSHKKEIAIGIGIGVAIGVGTYFVVKGRGKEALKTPIKDITNSNQAIKKATEIINGNADEIIKNSGTDLNGYSSNDERFICNWLICDKHRLDALTESDYLAMDNAQIHLEKGQNMYRVMNRAHEELRDAEYVSFSKEDRARYLGFLPKMWGVNRGGKRRDCFEAVLEANSDIKAPGKKETFDIMESALKKYCQNNVKANVTDEEIHADLLKNFNQYYLQLADRNDGLRKYFFNELKDKGYNACVDYNDANRLSDFPLILLDASKNAKVDYINKWSSKDTGDFMNNIALPKSVTDTSKSDFDNIMAKINDINDMGRLRWYMASQQFT